MGVDKREIDCPEQHVHGHGTETVFVFGENREDADGKEKTSPGIDAMIEQFTQCTARFRSTRLFPVHPV